MEPARVDFLPENLAYGGFELATRGEVLGARSVGNALRSIEGWPVLTFERGGVRHLLDGPLHYQVIERLGREHDCVVVVFGLGLGNTVRSLIAAGIKVAAVFEPEPGILRHYLEYGPSDLGGVPIVTNQRELDAIWLRVIGERDNVHLTDTPGYERAFASTRVDLAKKIEDLLERNLVNEQTIRARGRVWIQDIIDNAEFIGAVPSALNLQGAFRGVPAFIVGAGPSLNQNIEQIRDAAKKGIVFAVNSSARALDQLAIKPHILAALESIDVSGLIADLSFLDEVVRLFSLTAHPNLFKTGTGSLLTLFELLPHIAGPFESFYGRPGLPVCGSVSTACFSLAYRMGCDPIVLLGQDLAYTDGRCYADGTPYSESRVTFDEGGQSLRHDWCGTMQKTHENAENTLLPGQKATSAVAFGGNGTVQSAATFNHVRIWFERVATLINESNGPTLINATEGGARIANFEERKLSHVLEALPERDISSAQIYQAAQAGGPEMQVDDVIRLLRANQQGAEAVACAAQALAQASHAAETVWQESDSSLLSRRLRELQSAETELKLVVSQWPWVDAWAWAEVDAALVSKDEVTDLSEALGGIRREGRLGETIAHSAQALAECLELRQRELKAKYEK